MSPPVEYLPHNSALETDPRFFRAVQYVLGELSDTDAEAFEAALADDATLCAVVAQASQLLAGTEVALHASAPTVGMVSPISTPSSSPRRDRWTVSVLATAATVIAATWLSMFNPSAPTPFTVRPSQAVQLVSLWRNAGRTVVGSTASDTFDPEAAVPLHDDRVPPWMLAAVSLEHRSPRSSLNESTEPWEDN